MQKLKKKRVKPKNVVLQRKQNGPKKHVKPKKHAVPKRFVRQRLQELRKQNVLRKPLDKLRKLASAKKIALQKRHVKQSVNGLRRNKQKRLEKPKKLANWQKNGTVNTKLLKNKPKRHAVVLIFNGKLRKKQLNGLKKSA